MNNQFKKGDKVRFFTPFGEECGILLGAYETYSIVKISSTNQITPIDNIKLELISNLAEKYKNSRLLMIDTNTQYDAMMLKCKDLFTTKSEDYGNSWRILQQSSLTDLLFIKAKRIQSISIKGIKKVDEGIEPELIGIINYAIIALIQLDLGIAEKDDLLPEKAETLYCEKSEIAKSVMQNKNHDYGEAWRNMRISSLTDLILMKLFRIKQLEDHNGNTVISEGIDAGYIDIINYAIFALIRMDENFKKTIE